MKLKLREKIKLFKLFMKYYRYKFDFAKKRNQYIFRIPYKSCRVHSTHLDYYISLWDYEDLEILNPFYECSVSEHIDEYLQSTKKSPSQKQSIRNVKEYLNMLYGKTR